MEKYNERGFGYTVSVAGSCSLNSNCKLSSSASDEEMSALVSILAAVRVEPCRLALDGILLQGKPSSSVDAVKTCSCSDRYAVSFKFKYEAVKLQMKTAASARMVHSRFPPHSTQTPWLALCRTGGHWWM